MDGDSLPVPISRLHHWSVGPPYCLSRHFPPTKKNVTLISLPIITPDTDEQFTATYLLSFFGFQYPIAAI